MTLPEQQPDPVSTPAEGALTEAFGREIEAIDIDELDKENKGWVKKYVEQLNGRIGTEQAAPSPDFVMIAYLKREVATYQELLDRTEKK